MVKILFQHPNADVRLKTFPRVLENEERVQDGQTKRVPYPPKVDPETGLVFYEVSDTYARVLIGGQPDRYFLVEPASILVRRRMPDFTTKPLEVKAVTSAELKNFADERESDRRREKALADLEAERQRQVEILAVPAVRRSRAGAFDAPTAAAPKAPASGGNSQQQAPKAPVPGSQTPAPKAPVPGSPTPLAQTGSASGAPAGAPSNPPPDEGDTANPPGTL